MRLVEILVISVALAMDAFAVSIASGITLKTVSWRQTFRLSWHFGFFQALMPVLGWLAGSLVRSWVESFDHWVAFGLLAFIGGKMLFEAVHPERESRPRKDPTKGLTLVMLSIAVSIDAFAVGLSIAMLRVPILWPAFVIGVVTTLFTALGLYLSRLISRYPHLSMYAEIAGGLALLVIGVKILWEHGSLAFL
jgi:manganese efflux pump family protein